MTVVALNPLDLNQITLSGSNLTATATGSNAIVRANVGHCAGKHYFEANIGTQWGSSSTVGVCALGALNSILLDWLNAVLYQPASQFRLDGSNTGVTPTGYSTTSNLQYAIDLDNFMLWARPNGGNWNGSGTANPATNTGGLNIASIAHGGMYPYCAMGASGDNVTFNFDGVGTAFTGTVPSGFNAGWEDNTTTPYADGGATTNGGSGSGGALNVTMNTGGANRLLMLAINIDSTSGAPPTVSGITTSGLSWSKRGSLVYTTNNNIELWTALAPTQLTAATAAIALTGSCDRIDAVFVPWVNLPNVGFFDTNGALPATASGTTGTPTIAVTTTSGGVMLLGIVGSGSPSQIVTGGVPVSHGSGSIDGLIKGRRDGGGVNFNFVSVLGRYQSAAASAQSMPTNGAGTNWGMLGDALVFGSPVTEIDIPASNHSLGLAMTALLDLATPGKYVVVNVTN